MPCRYKPLKIIPACFFHMRFQNHNDPDARRCNTGGENKQIITHVVLFMPSITGIIPTIHVHRIVAAKKIHKCLVSFFLSSFFIGFLLFQIYKLIFMIAFLCDVANGSQYGLSRMITASKMSLVVILAGGYQCNQQSSVTAPSTKRTEYIFQYLDILKPFGYDPLSFISKVRCRSCGIGSKSF